MKRTILVWGLIAGLSMVGLQWVIYPLCYRGYISIGNNWLGYAGMLISFAIIFLGVRSYRDNQGGGSISFWKAVQIGLLITLVATVIHAAGAQAYNLVNPDWKRFFLEKYVEYKMEALPFPADQAAIAAVDQEAALLRAIYGNPVLEFVVTALMLVPVGLIATLISAAILRKKKAMPSTEGSM